MQSFSYSLFHTFKIMSLFPLYYVKNPSNLVSYKSILMCTIILTMILNIIARKGLYLSHGILALPNLVQMAGDCHGSTNAIYLGSSLVAFLGIFLHVASTVVWI